MNLILKNVSNLVVKTRPLFPYQRTLCSTKYANLSKSDIERIVKSDKVVVFMKGIPEQPRCGFSNAVVQILRMHGITYESHDVLSSDDLRQGIKEFTNWPTIPQIFINGEFIGGCDILLQMHQSGDLVEELKKCGITSALLKQAVNKDEKN